MRACSVSEQGSHRRPLKPQNKNSQNDPMQSRSFRTNQRTNHSFRTVDLMWPRVPFLETLSLTDGFASRLAKCLSIAVQSAGQGTRVLWPARLVRADLQKVRCASRP